MVRTVAFLRGRDHAAPETHTTRKQQRLDAPEGREQYGQRVATVEPVFANLRDNTRLDRFTQWLLFCLVHHIEKFSHAGYAAYITRREGRARSRVTPASRASLRPTISQCPIE